MLMPDSAGKRTNQGIRVAFGSTTALDLTRSLCRFLTASNCVALTSPVGWALPTGTGLSPGIERDVSDCGSQDFSQRASAIWIANVGNAATRLVGGAHRLLK